MTTVLLTGFEPFGGDASNPSGVAVRRVAERWTGPDVLITDVLPVTFSGAAERLRELIAQHSPDVVVAAGLAGNRSAISIERVAVNLADARIPDNDGAQPVDQPSVAGAPTARFATLPVKAIVRDLLAAGVPAEISYSAGTFVCNHVFFAAMDEASAHPGVRAGFIHVPWDVDHAPMTAPYLELDDIVRALEVAIRTSLAEESDIGAIGGAVS
ncbi:pyroglutamyl-peptidase I [Microbacterium lacus]|uniref:pyroglutamyl-peptidase I n=1 Tax=Microbacterium lacus TaxID=415217 RepID=UPI00384A7D2E